MSSKPLLSVPFMLMLAIAMAACGDSNADASSDKTLRILVTNDDGVGAEGIDAIVAALSADPNNEVIVSAPAENRSAIGDRISDGPVAVSQATTASGYPATAVDGTPADAVLYGLENLYPDGLPHLVVSGINAGQNLNLIMAGTISGTVGAARTAARHGVPALAASQGSPNFDFPSGVSEVLLWIDSNREDLLNPTGLPTYITNINIPSCDTGAIRGRVEVPISPDAGGYNMLGPQNCASDLEDPQTDVEAFFNGFVAISIIGLE